MFTSRFNLQKTYWFILGVLLLVLGSRLSAGAAPVLLEDFEKSDSMSRWRFDPGAEFPGASGSLSLSAPGHVGHAGHLAFDMSGGGNYVDARVDFDRPVTAAFVSGWVKSPPGVEVRLRVTDSSGQTLQYNAISRPLYARDASAWYPVMAQLSAPTSFWGGANTGRMNGGIQSMAILAEPIKQGSQYALASGAIEFDDLVADDSVFASIDPWAAVVGFPDPGNLASKLGINIHFTQDDRALDAIQATGCTWVRMDLDWSSVEKTKGTYDFSLYDQLQASLNARGLKPFFILDYGNPLYPESNPPATDSGRQAFGQFAQAASRHFGNTARYEIWNEENIARFWNPNPSPADYAALAQWTTAQLKAGNSAAEVCTGGLSGMDFVFLKNILAAGGAKAADAIGVHPYRNGSPETVADELLNLRQLAGSQPVWCTEWGYSSALYGLGDSAPALDSQAKLTSREILSAWLLGFPMIIDYDIRDDGANPQDPEQRFGLLTQAYQPKPAMTALRTLLDQTRGRQVTGMYSRALPGLNALKLKSGQDIVLLLWLDSGNQAQSIRFPQAPLRLLDNTGHDLVPSDRISMGDSLLYAVFSKQPPAAAASAAALAAPTPNNPVTRSPLNVWPNPSRDRVHFSWPATQAEKISIVIYNMAGERVAILQASGQDQQTTWDARGMAAGVYIYHMTAGKTGKETLLGKGKFVLTR